MKKMNYLNKTAFTPRSKIALWLGASLLISGCVSLPFISYEEPPLQTQTDEKSHSFSVQNVQKNIYNPPLQHLTPSITSPKKPLFDVNQTFHPIIWDEMQHKFHLAIEHLGQYNSNIDSIKKRPHSLTKVSQRAKPYLHYILSQVKLRDMPYELALLPIIESGFRPIARSNQNAGGLWQFIPSTALSFGLEQNEWYDGRQDFIKSTHAALDYLQELYRINNNDWLLALASYNAGPGRVKQAIKKYGKKQNNTQPNFWDIQPYLPKETQNYIPKLLAVSHVINHAKSFNIDLEPIENIAFFTEIKLSKQVQLDKVMQLASVSKTTFTQLNAGYLEQTTPPNGPYNILLPNKQAQKFQLLMTSNHNLFDIEWQKHTIKSGESLSVIAQNYKTSQKAIKKINNMKSHRLRAGKTLLIPVLSTSKQIVANRHTPPYNATNNRAIKVTLKKGQSLWSIAQQYNVTTNDLVRWNNITRPNTVKPGIKLTVWPSKATKTSQKKKFVQYKIRSGDSLWEIAQKNRVSTKRLASYNNLSIKAYLKPGQILKIPIRG